MKFSPAEISAFVIAFFSFCLMMMNIVDKIINYRRELQRPEIEQNTRIDNLEHRTAKIESKLDNDNRRLNTLEESNRVMLRGMSALLSHGINGNNIPEMEKARDELNDFLVSSKWVNRVFRCKYYIPGSIKCWSRPFRECLGEECKRMNNCKSCRYSERCIGQEPCRRCEHVMQKIGGEMLWNSESQV